MSIVWLTTNFGFTSFNIFLPKLLISKIGTMSTAYQDALFYSIAGIPGSLGGAFLVETILGRKWTMFIFTAMSGGFMFAFALAQDYLEVMAFSCVVSFASQIMYAAVYTYTPEVFPTIVRTSMGGFLSTLAKISGIVAPFTTGLMLDVSKILPLYVSFGFMVVGAMAIALLPIETRGMKLE